MDSLPSEPRGKPKNTRVGSPSLFQGIFPTQKSNQGLLHCRRILYQLSYQLSHIYIFFFLIGIQLLYSVVFLIYGQVNQLYVYIHPLFFGFPSHLVTTEH